MSVQRAHQRAGGRPAAVVCALAAEKRRHPADDVITRLCEAEPRRHGPQRLSEGEIATFALLLGAAGSETVTELIGSGLVLFHRCPAQWSKVVSDPRRIPGAVEGNLRYWAERAARRRARAPRDLSGRGARRREGLPRFVERELREFLTCGVMARGFARFRCDGCAREILVAFSCRSRGAKATQCQRPRGCPAAGGAGPLDRVAGLPPARRQRFAARDTRFVRAVVGSEGSPIQGVLSIRPLMRATRHALGASTARQRARRASR